MIEEETNIPSPSCNGIFVLMLSSKRDTSAFYVLLGNLICKLKKKTRCFKNDVWRTSKRNLSCAILVLHPKQGTVDLMCWDCSKIRIEIHHVRAQSKAWTAGFLGVWNSTYVLLSLVPQHVAGKLMIQKRCLSRSWCGLQDLPCSNYFLMSQNSFRYDRCPPVQKNGRASPCECSMQLEMTEHLNQQCIVPWRSLLISHWITWMLPPGPIVSTLGSLTTWV